MTDDQKPKPLNGHDISEPVEDQPEPATDLELANQRVGKMISTVRAGVATTRQVNMPAIVSDAALQSCQIRALIALLVEAKLIDPGDFNRRLGENAANITEQLSRPQIALAVGEALRTKQ